MEKRIKKHSNLLIMAIVFSIVSSLSLCIASLVRSDNKWQKIIIIGAIIFWMGLIAEQIAIYKASTIMQEMLSHKRRRFSARAGIISFATNREGLVADISFLIFLLSWIISRLFELEEAFWQYMLISLIVLTFRMHCILNGKNYRYKKMLERKVESNND